MDLFRRIFTWLRGDNVIVDPERAITNETASEAINLESRTMTCNCHERITSLEQNIERLTSWVHTLRIRIDRNDADIERTIDYIRSRYEVEYSPTYVNQERESVRVLRFYLVYKIEIQVGWESCMLYRAFFELKLTWNMKNNEV